MLQSIRGFTDIYDPVSVHQWQTLESILISCAEQHGYTQIRLPFMEPTELFARAIGSTSDIVHKEMYTFVDKNGKYIYFIKRNLYENITKLMEEELKGIKFCGNIINDLKIKPKVTVKDDYDKSVYITVKTSIENTEGCRSLYNDDEIFHLSIHSGRRPEILNQSEIHLKINGFNNEKESWDLYKEGDDYKFKYYVKN